MNKNVLQELIDKNPFNQTELVKWSEDVFRFCKETVEINLNESDMNEIKEYIDGIKTFGFKFNYYNNLKGKLKYYQSIYSYHKNDNKSKKVFIAMSFANGNNDIYDKVYKIVCENLNCEAIRIDKINFTGSIISQIEKEIMNSCIIIADLTQNNGGVYYELGIAKGLELSNHTTNIVLTCEKSFFDEKGVHFDVKGYNIILYEKNNLKEFENNLLRTISKIINP